MDTIYWVLIIILLVIALLGIYFFLKGSGEGTVSNEPAKKPETKKKWAFGK